jgi:hypothetical protein
LSVTVLTLDWVNFEKTFDFKNVQSSLMDETVIITMNRSTRS